MQEYKKEATSHIIGTSSNLIGICLLITTALKFGDISKATSLDEMATFASVVFSTSIIFAYLSMRHNAKRIVLLRDIADYMFLFGILLLVLAMILVATSIMA